MKFFHLSDLHIGLKLINRDLIEDQRHILSQIVQAAAREQPDAVVVAGDIYDKSIPPAEAVEVFDGFISALCSAVPAAEIMLISGNHDSAARLNLFRGLLRRQRVHMIGLPPRQGDKSIEVVHLSDAWGRVDFYLLPFVRPSMVRAVTGADADGTLSYDAALHRLIDREALDPRARNVLVSHQFYVPCGTAAEQVERTDFEIRTVGNIDQVSSDVLERFDYAALGHLHRPTLLNGGRARYCGAPLACSVSEAGQQKAILCVELREKGDLQVTPIPLHPLRALRVIRGKLAQVLAQPCDDYVSVVLTDSVDLDAADMRDRLSAAFPNLLEIRREGLVAPDYEAQIAPESALNPLELCGAFLPDLDADGLALLRDVINAVREAQ